MTYREFVIKNATDLVQECGGVKKASLKSGIDIGVISKISRGKYIPKPKTIEKMFGVEVPEDLEDVVEVPSEPSIVIKCKELDELKELLNGIGYEIVIRKRA